MSQVIFLQVLAVSFLLAVLEQTLTWLFHTQAIVLQLLIVFFAYVGIRVSLRGGVVFALWFFLLKDVGTAGAFGISFFAFLACLPVFHFLRTRFDYEGFFAESFLAWLTMVMFQSVYALIATLFFDKEYGFSLFAHAIILNPLLNALIAVPCYAAYKRIIRITLT